MTGIAAAAGAAFSSAGRFVAVTGRDWQDLAALVDAAAAHVVAPGPTTRLSIGEGVVLGGHRAVVVADVARPWPVSSELAVVTQQPAAAAAALRAGWSVVQPAAARDVADLLATAPSPSVVLLGDHEGYPDADGVAPARPVRQWHQGDLATLVGSGAALAPMLHLADRLHARGVDVTVVEAAALTTRAHAPLVGGEAIAVGSAAVATSLRQGRWPDAPMHVITLRGMDDAELIGAVLARVSAG